MDSMDATRLMDSFESRDSMICMETLGSGLVIGINLPTLFLVLQILKELPQVQFGLDVEVLGTEERHSYAPLKEVGIIQMEDGILSVSVSPSGKSTPPPPTSIPPHP